MIELLGVRFLNIVVLTLLEGYVGMAIVGSAVIGFIAAASMWARRR